MSEPSYIVIRAPGEEIDGRWYDVNDIPPVAAKSKVALPVHVEEVVFVPTGEIEVRDDGAVAEVYRRMEGATE